MEQIRQSIEECENLRAKLPRLREDKSKEGLILYYKTLLEVTDKQHNMYTRLRLIGDQPSTEIADEMEKIAIDYMGRSTTQTMDAFMKQMKREITWQLNLMSAGKYDRTEDRE